jgi:MFS family permease
LPRPNLSAATVQYAAPPAAGEQLPGGRKARHFQGPRFLEALSYSQYRRYSIAATLSFTAFAVQMLVRGWLVQDLTHSPFLVSLVPALMMLPMLVFTLIGGELADRFPRPKVTLIGDAAAMSWYVLLALLLAGGGVRAWQVLAITGAQGMTGALIGPARQSMIADLVPQQVQRGAIGLSSLTFNIAQIAGPALGGILLARFGALEASVASAILVLPALPLYATLKPAGGHRPRPEGSVLHHLRDGLAYVASSATMRWLLLGGLVLVLTVNAWGAMFPPLALDELGQDAGGLATLATAVGIGAVMGTVVSVILGGGRTRDGVVETGSGFAFAVVVGAVGASPWFPLTVAFAGLAALAGTVFFVTNMTVMQMAAPPEYRGRVISVRFLMFGLSPLGMVALGALAEETGPRLALGVFAIAGAALLALVQLFARSRGSAHAAAGPGPAEP